MISPWIANLVVGLVAAVWVTAFAVSLINPAYRIDPQLHAIFGGATSAAMFIRRRDEPSSKEASE